MPLRGSVIGWPVETKAFSTSLTVAVGFFCFRIAHAPATWGAAIEVPEKVKKSSFGIEDTITEPGASKLRNDAELEKHEIASSVEVPKLCVVQLLLKPALANVEPTLIALEMQPGLPKELV